MTNKNRPTKVLLQILEYDPCRKQRRWALIALLGRAEKLHQLWRLYYCAVTNNLGPGLKGRILWKIVGGKVSRSNLEHVLFAAESAGLSRLSRKVTKLLARHP